MRTTGPTAVAFVILAAGSAAAQPAGTPVIHPIYVSVRGSAHDETAQKAFGETVSHYRLGPVETIDIPAEPTPRAPDLLRAGKTAFDKLNFDEAQAALDAAAQEVLQTGGAGLDTASLSDLFTYQAIAAQRADWKELTGPVTEVVPPKARQAYARALSITPDRVLAPRRFPPLAVASWALLAAEAKQRPRGTIVVRGAATAEVVIDGGQPLLTPATVPDLPYGEHLIRVSDPGRAPWVEMVPLAELTLEIDVAPTAAVMVDDARAAAQARRMNAAFALVAQLKPGAPIRLELSLVDAATGQRRDAVSVPLSGEPGALDAAVMRLDEDARKRFVERYGRPLPTTSAELSVAQAPITPTRTRTRFSDSPGTWAKQRWPLLTALGVAVGTAIILGFAVATDDAPSR